jgi:AcrR family transcriptional regulator
MSREEQKQQRRHNILVAAETLIRRTGGTDFTMVELAEQAELSPATPYNLFGSKTAILYTLLNRALSILMNDGDAIEVSKNPVERAVMTMANAASVFIADPNLFRPLYKFQISVKDEEFRPAYMDRALEFWRSALDGLVEAGYLSDDNGGNRLNRDEMARALIAHSIGVIDLWVKEELDDTEFHAQMTHDAALLLFSTADADGQVMLLNLIRQVRCRMTKRFSFRKNF